MTQPNSLQDELLYIIRKTEDQIDALKSGGVSDPAELHSLELRRDQHYARLQEIDGVDKT